MGIEDADGDETTRDYVKGEALLWRAYAYFKLLQYYSPYKNNELGIPVNLDPVTDIAAIKPVRNTQSEVYSRVIEDCEAALKLLERTPGDSWNFLYNEPFINSFLAAVYHYKALSGAGEESDWRNAEVYAGKAMQGRTLVNTAAALKEIFDAGMEGIANFKNLKSDEFFIRIMDGPNGFIFNYAYNARSPADGSVNPAWLSFYKDGDIRKQVYFSEDGSANTKYNLQSLSGTMGYGLLMPFRLAEMYLIKSEALLRQGKTAESRTVLEQFKAARYSLPQTVSDNSTALLADILDERSREFYRENDFIWLDFKRLGKPLSRIVDGEEYKLSPDDYRYSFPIPATELFANRELMQNPGWDQFVK